MKIFLDNEEIKPVMGKLALHSSTLSQTAPLALNILNYSPYA